MGESQLIPKNRGDIVSYQNYVLARMPEVWGEDAAVFNPSRWLQENGESISYSPFSESPATNPLTEGHDEVTGLAESSLL